MSALLDRIGWRIASLLGTRAQMVYLRFQMRRLNRDVKALRQLLEKRSRVAA